MDCEQHQVQMMISRGEGDRRIVISDININIRDLVMASTPSYIQMCKCNVDVMTMQCIV